MGNVNKFFVDLRRHLTVRDSMILEDLQERIQCVAAPPLTLRVLRDPACKYNCVEGLRTLGELSFWIKAITMIYGLDGSSTDLQVFAARFFPIFFPELKVF